MIWAKFRTPPVDTNPLSGLELEDVEAQGGSTFESVAGFAPDQRQPDRRG